MPIRIHCGFIPLYEATKVNRPKQGEKVMDSRSDVPFDCAAFLLSAGLDRRTIELDQDERFFTQGDSADYVFYLQKGRAKLSVVSGEGKQATILLLFPGDFFGEGSLGTEPGLRLATAIAEERRNASHDASGP
jgi:CRP-like cAMP-binding protein